MRSIHLNNAIGFTNKYHAGEIVYARENPELKLVVRCYVDRIYYCTNMDFPERKEKVYYERELI